MECNGTGCSANSGSNVWFKVFRAAVISITGLVLSSSPRSLVPAGELLIAERSNRQDHPLGLGRDSATALPERPIVPSVSSNRKDQEKQ